MDDSLSMMGVVFQCTGTGVESKDGGCLFFINVACLCFRVGGGFGLLNCRRRPMHYIVY